MKNLIKLFLFIIATLTTGAIITTSCSNTEEINMDASQDAQVTTRAVGTKTPKLAMYIETNDVNPLNAGEYKFCNTTEEVIDYVILFASNIRGNADSVWLHHNDNQQHILDNVNTLVRPLQQKGIKVLLGLLGDHTGVGFSNLTPAMRDSFAQQVADCVTTYGLDGINYDEEYADYWKAPSGLPTPSSTIFGQLIQDVRQLLPNEVHTLFYFDVYATGINQASRNALDYLFPDFGCWDTPPADVDSAQWAKLSVRMNPLIPGQAVIQNCANNYARYGAIMGFNLVPSTTTTTRLNYFASRVWGGRTVCWSGITHPHW